MLLPNGRSILVAVLPLLVLAAGPLPASGQAEPGDRSAGEVRKAVYLELLGNSPTYTVNVDLRYANWGMRLGAGVADASPNGTVMVNYLPGTEHSLELGAGLATFEVPFDGRDLLGTGTIGYRYQPVDGGDVYRVGFTPFLGSEGFVPFVGLSFGAAF